MSRPSITSPFRRAPEPRGKHRAKHRGGRAPLRRQLAAAAVAAGATAAVVSGGVLAADLGQDSSVQALMAGKAAGAAADSTVLDRMRAEREQRASRSGDRRTTVDMTKVRMLRQETSSGGQVTRTKDLGSGDPRAIAAAMLGQYGWSSDQMGCLDSLWTKESGWSVTADNPTSSAYGIPQALPGSKMASAGADWATNPATQIEWGLGYIADRYGSPCAAWAHSQANNWY